MSKENSAGETIGATTTIILEPARISGSTVEPSRREIARKRRKERRLNWALVLGMLVFAVFWLLGMQLVSWLAVGVPLMWRLVLAVSSLVFAAASMVPLWYMRFVEKGRISWVSGWLMWPLNMSDCTGSSGSLCRFAVLIASS